MTHVEEQIIHLFDDVANDMIAISPSINQDTMARNIRNFHYALLQTITEQIQAECHSEADHPLYDTRETLIGMGNKWLGNKEVVV